MKKILIIVPSFVVGGSEKVQFLVAQNLEKKKNYSVTVFFLSKKNYNERTFWSDLKNSEIVHSNKLKEKYGVLSLLKYLILNKFNLIFSSNSHINGFISLLKILKILRRTKVVVRESNDVYNRFQNKKILMLYSFYHQLYRGSNKVVFQNHKMLDKFIKKNPFVTRKSIVLKNPVSVNYDLKSYKSNEKSIVMIGRLNNNKNQILALKLIKNLMDKKKLNFKLDIYGQGPLKEFLSNYIIENKLEKNIKIITKYHSVKEIFKKKYSIFLHLSFFEGFPNVILEAANHMIPTIITTNCAGGLNKIPKIIFVKNELNDLVNVVKKQVKNKQNFSKYYKSYLIENHNVKIFKKKLLK